MSCKPGKKFSAGYFDFCYHCILHQRKQGEIGQKINSKVLKIVYPDSSLFGNLNFIENTHSHKHHVYLCLVLQVKDEYRKY